MTAIYSFADSHFLLFTLCILGAYGVLLLLFAAVWKWLQRPPVTPELPQGVYGVFQEPPAVPSNQLSFAARRDLPKAKRTYRPVMSFTVKAGDDLDAILAKAEKRGYHGEVP